MGVIAEPGHFLGFVLGVSSVLSVQAEPSCLHKKNGDDMSRFGDEFVSICILPRGIALTSL
jgi:hypothetical protein